MLWSSLNVLELHVPWHANMIHLWNVLDLTLLGVSRGDPAVHSFTLFELSHESVSVALLPPPCHRVLPQLWIRTWPQYLISSLNLSSPSPNACFPQLMGLGHCRAFGGTLGEYRRLPTSKENRVFGDPRTQSTWRVVQPRTQSVPDSNWFPVIYSLSFILSLEKIWTICKGWKYIKVENI